MGLTSEEKLLLQAGWIRTRWQEIWIHISTGLMANQAYALELLNQQLSPSLKRPSDAQRDAPDK